ncbi:MAG: hypothetical protein KAS67_00705, partial [Thermoplasmata archaeon]|nr:hypothetical protein [Thermoplasmata archaeon]
PAAVAAAVDNFLVPFCNLFNFVNYQAINDLAFPFCPGSSHSRGHMSKLAEIELCVHLMIYRWTYGGVLVMLRPIHPNHKGMGVLDPLHNHGLSHDIKMSMAW